MTYPISRVQAGAPLTLAQHDGNLRSGGGFPTIAEMLADTTAWTVGDMLMADGHRYEVVDAGAVEARHVHLTTSGSAALKVLPGHGGVYDFRAFNPAADGVTDDYPVLDKAINAMRDNFTKSPSTIYITGPTLYIPNGRYYIGQTVELKSCVQIRGDGSGVNNGGGAQLIFPHSIVGIRVNRHNTWKGTRVRTDFADSAEFAAHTGTYENFLNESAGLGGQELYVGEYVTIRSEGLSYQAVDSGASTYDVLTAGGTKWEKVSDMPPVGTAEGSSISNIRITTSDGSPHLRSKDSHGLAVQAACLLSCVGVSWFGGNGFHLEAHSDRAGPAGGRMPHGNINVAHVWNCNAIRCETGFFVRGYDGNALTIMSCDATSNRRYGFWDSSFLGNTFFACHGQGNGNSTNEDKWCICTHNGRLWSLSPWVDEATALATEPGTDEDVWTDHGSGSWPPAWTGAPSGQFRSGGNYVTSRIVNGVMDEFTSHGTSFVGCYSEDGTGAVWLSRSAMWIGGASSKIKGAQMRGGNYTLETGAIRTSGEMLGTELSSTFGAGDGGTGEVLKWREEDAGVAVSGTWRLRKSGKSWAFTHDNTRIAYLTHDDAVVPVTFCTPKLGFGDGGGDTRTHQYDTAAPTTGTWRQGDIVWNAAPQASGVAGWMCVNSGMPGTWAPIQLGAAI